MFRLKISLKNHGESLSLQIKLLKQDKLIDKSLKTRGNSVKSNEKPN